MLAICQLLIVFVVTDLGIQVDDVGVHVFRLKTSFFHETHHCFPIIVRKSDNDAAKQMTLFFGKRLDLAYRKATDGCEYIKNIAVF